MGICFSSTKVVSGSNSNTTNNDNRKRNPSTTTESTATTAGTAQKQTAQKRKGGSDETAHKKNHHQHHRLKDKTGSRHVPCGKRTDFGYEKDFDKRFSLGKLLGHGQFGYTYVGVDKSNGDRVAVKRLEKAKVLLFLSLRFSSCCFDSQKKKKKMVFFDM